MDTKKRFPTIITNFDCEWANITFHALVQAGEFELALELAKDLHSFYNYEWIRKIEDLELKIKASKESDQTE